MELVWLCVFIFVVRIFDVALGTVRVVVTVKGKTFLAAAIGFIEVTIWFLVVKDALNNDFNSLWIVFSYAGGFSIGTYLGSILSKKFIRGKLNVQIIIDRDKKELINILRREGYAISVIDAKGYEYRDKLLLMIGIDCTKLDRLETIVKETDEKAFIIVNEAKYIQNGYFQGLVK